MSNERVILSNQAVCGACGDRPFSRHRHDFVSCKCENVSVDGGMDYLRRVAKSEEYRDISIEMDADLVKVICEDLRPENNNYNPLGQLCSVMRHLRDAGYDVESPVVAAQYVDFDFNTLEPGMYVINNQTCANHPPQETFLNYWQHSDAFGFLKGDLAETLTLSPSGVKYIRRRCGHTLTLWSEVEQSND